MNIKLKNNNGNLSWKDLDYGDVFIFKDSLDDEYKEYIGMKILDINSNEYLFDMQDYMLYSDIDMYKIIRKEADHIYDKRNDNRKSQLQICTHRQNNLKSN